MLTQYDTYLIYLEKSMIRFQKYNNLINTQLRFT